MVRLGTKITGQLIANITDRLKSYVSKELTDGLWLEIVNDKISSIHAALGIADRAIYRDREVLTDSSTGQDGVIDFYDSGSSKPKFKKSTKLLTFSSGAFSGNNSPHIATANAIPIGSTVILKAENGGEYFRIAKVAASSSATAVILDRDLFPETTPDDDISLFDILVMVGLTSDSIYLGGLSSYKYIDQILSIYSTAINDECRKCETISDYRGIQKSLPYNAKFQIIWTRDGEYLYFDKGASVSSYGVRTAYFSRNPYPSLVLADLLDIPDSYDDLLTKLCMLDGLHTLKVPIPTELKSAETQLAAMKKASDEEYLALMQDRGDKG